MVFKFVVILLILSWVIPLKQKCMPTIVIYKSNVFSVEYSFIAGTFWRIVPPPNFQHGARRVGIPIGTLHRVYETRNTKLWRWHNRREQLHNSDSKLGASARGNKEKVISVTVWRNGIDAIADDCCAPPRKGASGTKGIVIWTWWVMSDYKTKNNSKL